MLTLDHRGWLVYSKTSLSVISTTVILHIHRLLSDTTISIPVDFLNHLAFINMNHRACNHAACFSQLTTLLLFNKPVIHWQLLTLFIYFHDKSLHPYLLQSIKKAKRPRIVKTLEIKPKINATFEVGKRAVEADLCCYKAVLIQIKKPTLQQTKFLSKMIYSPQLLHFKLIQ
jgi:hypothetical protein